MKLNLEKVLKSVTGQVGIIILMAIKVVPIETGIPLLTLYSGILIGNGKAIRETGGEGIAAPLVLPKTSVDVIEKDR